MMKIGIPKGLLYSKYHMFARTFLEEMGAEVVVSPDTNRKILDDGVQGCVDEACLPIKVFHGHVSWLKERCDALLVPRFMGVREKEYICPMFCGLPDMISNNIPNLPVLINTPIYRTDGQSILKWAQEAGRVITRDNNRIASACNKALEVQRDYRPGFYQRQFQLRVALIGHTYNINDQYVNMGVIKKLNHLGVGVITEEYANGQKMAEEIGKLFKRPFWSFGASYYGAAVSLCREKKVDGVIYLSSFSCGIDSVVTELIKNEIEGFPFMVLKLDEHTGEAGVNTRIEAFSDMLKRRVYVGCNVSSYGQHIYRGKSAI